MWGIWICCGSWLTGRWGSRGVLRAEAGLGEPGPVEVGWAGRSLLRRGGLSCPVWVVGFPEPSRAEPSRAEPSRAEPSR
ncbi:hypothetical protein SAMN05421837_1161, partial [Amycolatopsis pretoriensis]